MKRLNHKKTMIDHKNTEPPIFMIAPAICWSVVTESPHTRTAMS